MHQPLPSSTIRRLRQSVANYIDMTFDGAARTLIRYRIGRENIEQLVRGAVVDQTSDEARRFIADATQRADKNFEELVRTETVKLLKERLELHPLDALVKNAVDDTITPLIKPLIERAVKDTESRLDAILRPAMQDVIEKRVGDATLAQIKECFDLHPLDALVKIAVDEITAPSIKPLIERAVKDTEGRLDTILRPALQDVVETRVSDAAFAQMMQETTDQVARAKPAQTKIPRKEVEVRQPEDIQHKQFMVVLGIVSPKLSDSPSKALLVGPSGTGKTIIAKGIAAELGLAFYFNGPIQSEYKLTGYKDATGRYHYTPFRQAYENGGVYLFDEFDACSAQALVAFNTALSNKVCDFPDGPVKQHKNFVCIAAANTYGDGANKMHTGRERLDSATLDRFAVVDIEYDDALERKLANDNGWVTRVQRYRHVAREQQPQLVISMRASIDGAELLRRGYSMSEVEDWVLWRGRLPRDKIEEIKRRAYG